jgi:hypothetical protein
MGSIIAGDNLKFETDQGLLQGFSRDGSSVLGRITLKTLQFHWVQMTP